MWKCGEAAAERSDYLTEQVRLYAMTGQSKYMDAYFEEAETIMATRKIAVMVDEKAEVRKEYLPDVLVDGIMAKQSREKALDILKRYFDGTETQTARIKERVFLKMQTRHSIM